MSNEQKPDIITPPSSQIGVLGWLKKNLFSTWYNIVLTIFSIAVIYLLLKGILTWVFYTQKRTMGKMPSCIF